MIVYTQTVALETHIFHDLSCSDFPKVKSETFNNICISGSIMNDIILDYATLSEKLPLHVLV